MSLKCRETCNTATILLNFFTKQKKCCNTLFVSIFVSQKINLLSLSCNIFKCKIWYFFVKSHRREDEKRNDIRLYVKTKLFSWPNTYDIQCLFSFRPRVLLGYFILSQIVFCSVTLQKQNIHVVWKHGATMKKNLCPQLRYLLSFNHYAGVESERNTEYTT